MPSNCRTRVSGGRQRDGEAEVDRLADAPRAVSRVVARRVEGGVFGLVDLVEGQLAPAVGEQALFAGDEFSPECGDFCSGIRAVAEGAHDGLAGSNALGQCRLEGGPNRDDSAIAGGHAAVPPWVGRQTRHELGCPPELEARRAPCGRRA